MELIFTAIVFIVIFSILVLIHEFGHFYAARKSGIKVEEFGFGLPPRIWGVKKGETLYSINWIPFGGFVRLLGEDARDKKALKDKRSFAVKPPRVRILVITAGVLMNLLLAVVLLTFGFIFGIQPLILSADEVLENIDNGHIHFETGILVETIDEDGPAERAGMLPDDRIVEIDGAEITSTGQLDSLTNNVEGGTTIVTVERADLMQNLNVLAGEGQDLGFETYELLFLPRIVIMDVKEGSASQKAGLQKGDIILSINGAPVYFVDEYEIAINRGNNIIYGILRDNNVLNVPVDLAEQNLVVISSVFPDTPAQRAGVEKGDVILSVNGETVVVPEDVVKIAGSYSNQSIEYLIKRDGLQLPLSIAPDEQGFIGVGLSVINSFRNEELSVYASDFPVSVTKIDDVRYPFWIAPFKAVDESVRLGFLTVGMAGDLFRSIFTQLTVPEGIAGPVGIAQLTHVFVQEGFLSLIRFVALLSLSLAIINILPFPALDGGRLLFIIAEVILGRRVGAKFEAWIHAVGFLILMLIILLVTYSDILRFF